MKERIVDYSGIEGKKKKKVTILRDRRSNKVELFYFLPGAGVDLLAYFTPCPKAYLKLKKNKPIERVKLMLVED